MLAKTELWGQMQQALNAIATKLSPVVMQKLEATSINLQNLYALGVAYYVHPEPIVFEHLRQRNPYSHEARLQDTIQRLRDAGHIDESDVITKSAYNEYQSLIDAQNAQAESLNLMNEAELVELAGYLKRAHDKALSLDAPSFQLVTSRPLPENAVHRIYYLIYRFTALRDDAHIQAWQHLNTDGHRHETASLVWDGTATTAEKFMETREYRGYEVSDWQQTLDKLVEKGWLIKDGDGYIASEDYSAIRKDVETRTDEYFYQIFTDFDENEIDKLLILLQGVQEKFRSEPEAT